MRRPTPAEGIATAGACLPVLGSLARVGADWRPAGDVALMTIRAQDVFSRHLPLLGMPSTASGEGADRIQVHHLGPLQVWLTGFARWIWDAPRASLAVAVLVNLAAIVGALWWTRRAFGERAMLLVGLGFALIGWSLRGEVVASPFNPYAGLMPFVAFGVALVAAGRARGATTGAVVLGSFAAQAHLVYAGPVLVAGLAAVAVHGWGRPAGGRGQRGRWGAVTALAVCWSGPALDVVLHEGGNVRALLRREGGVALGWDRGLDVAVRSLVPLPAGAWSGADPLALLAPPGVAHRMVAMALVGLLVVTAVRQRGRATSRAAVIALAALGAATAFTSLIPDLAFNSLALHNYLPYWPISLAVWGVALAGAAELGQSVAGRLPLSPARTALLASFAVVVTGLAGTLPPVRPTLEAERARVGLIAVDTLARIDRSGRYQVALGPGFEPFAIEAGLAAALDRAGVDVLLSPSVAPAVGAHRTGGEVDGHLLVVIDDRDPPDRSKVLAEGSFERADGTIGHVAIHLTVPETAPPGPPRLAGPGSTLGAP